MKMAIIGSGYVGTVTGACLAEMGHDVVCADLDKARIETLQQGTVPFYEEGLETLMRSNMAAGRLAFTADITQAIQHGEMVFLCIGPKGNATERPDPRFLQQAAKDIAVSLVPGQYKLIVEKSTLPIKTGDFLKQTILAELPPDIDASQVEVAAVPQFMREGKAIKDFMHPDRIVIGAESQRAIDALVQIYRPLSAPMLITDINSAELIKHATNAFLAMKISFMNSIAQLCEKTGADINEVAKGLGMDKRIGSDYLHAGLGYGGIFFSKDIHSLLTIGKEYYVNLDLLKQTEDINRYQRISFIERIERVVAANGHVTSGGHGGLEGKTIAIWGLTYRPNTDDMRDAPSIQIIRGLSQRGATIRAFDPLAMEKTRAILPKVTYCTDAYEAAEGADAIAILTEWPLFTALDFQQLKERTACRTIIDGRNLFSPSRMRQMGFAYHSIGRLPVQADSVPAGVSS